MLFTRRSDATAHGSILKWGYTDKYIRIIRMIGGSAQSTDWEKISAGYADTAGNADTATKLATARTINGTAFDGSANITTANWGTARNISIADSDSTNTGSAVSVNGSAAVTLKLPATIKAALSGNADSATKLKTTRTIWGQTFDGTDNVSGAMSGVTNINLVHPAAYTIEGTDVLNMNEMDDRYLTKEVFYKIFSPVFGTNGNLENLQVRGGLWTNSYISALGQNSSQG
jgi:hypothetical protein